MDFSALVIGLVEMVESQPLVEIVEIVEIVEMVESPVPPQGAFSRLLVEMVETQLLAILMRMRRSNNQ